MFNIHTTIAEAQLLHSSQLKASYIFNFSRFAQWPNEEQLNGFKIGVVGNSEIFQVIKQQADLKNENGEKWQVIEIQSESDAITCQIIVFSGATNTEIISMIAALKNTPILTIGDNLPDFITLGGIINMNPEEDPSSKFHVNFQAAKKSNIVLSASFLDLSTVKVVEKK